MKKKSSILISGFLFTGILLMLDQFTKYLAKTYLSGTQGVAIFPSVFQLFYLENRGAAFGMLTNRQGFFVAVAALMCLAAIYLYFRLPATRHYRLMRIICILIVSGAVGNMLDRVIHTFVIDFLYFSLIDFPVFNVADCYVCIGAALAILSVFTVYKDDDFAFLFPGKAEESGKLEEAGNDERSEHFECFNKSGQVGEKKKTEDTV